MTARRSSASARRRSRGQQVAWRLATRKRCRDGQLVLDDVADAPLALPPDHLLRRQPEPGAALLAEHVRVQGDRLVAPDRRLARDQDRVALAAPARARPAVPSARVSLRPRTAGTGTGPSFGRSRARGQRLHPAPVAEPRQRPDRDLLQADDVRRAGRDQLDHRLAGARAGPAARRCRRRGSRCGRALRSTVGDRARRPRRSARLHARGTTTSSPTALARGGRRRRARHLPLPLRRAAAGRRDTAAASGSTRSPRASSAARALRLPLKAAEHLGVAALARAHPRRRAPPAVARAAPDRRQHQLPSPRRSSPPTTCCRDGPPTSATSGAACFGSSTASSCTPRYGRESLARASAIDPVVIPHPVYPSAAGRADDGQTLLALGVIRPYKGLPDAIEVEPPPPGRPPARRRRPGDAARRAPRRAADRVAARLPDHGRARPRPRRRDGRDLPLPRRARPVGRAAAGARSRRAGRRLRRRRARRAGRALRRRARRSRRRRRRAHRGGARAPRRPGRARGRARRRRAGARRADLGRRRPPRTSTLYRELA